MDENEKFDEQFGGEAEDIQDGEAVQSGKKQKTKGREVLEWVEAIVIAVLIALFVRSFIMTVVMVDGNSMQDTLQNADRLIVWRLLYEPEQGDVIVFEPDLPDGSKKYYVKRVIATEGQSVKIDYDTNTVYVDGEALDEPYIYDEEDPMEPVFARTEWTVDDGCVFVMGDHRNNSSDSRNESVGMVRKESILGHVIFRFWPLNSIGLIE